MISVLATWIRYNGETFKWKYSKGSLILFELLKWDRHKHTFWSWEDDLIFWTKIAEVHEVIEADWRPEIPRPLSGSSRENRCWRKEVLAPVLIASRSFPPTVVWRNTVLQDFKRYTKQTVSHAPIVLRHSGFGDKHEMFKDVYIMCYKSQRRLVTVCSVFKTYFTPEIFYYKIFKTTYILNSTSSRKWGQNGRQLGREMGEPSMYRREKCITYY